MKSKLVLTVLFCFSFTLALENAAKITLIEGSASVLKKGSEETRPAKLSMPLQLGDKLHSDAETFVEITYTNGEITRVGENTDITIVTSTPKKVQTEILVGKVWVNMKKLTVKGRDFEMSSPTATAAIRGTIFNMCADSDSSTIVNVYNGKVAVGPSGTATDKSKDTDYKLKEPSQVQGPSEIPGPYEVTLEKWVEIAAGQQITVHADKKYATQKFDTTAVADDFIRKNIELDTKNSMNK